MIKLSRVAKELGVTKMTLWNWRAKGLLDFHKIGSLNFIDLETFNKLKGIEKTKNDKTVIYARVSSTENKSNLESQKNRLINYCMAKGYQIDRIVTEIGSGVNDSRPKLERLLKEQDFFKLIVEHKDRLTRFGFNYIKTLLEKNNIVIEIVNNATEEKEDIIQDFVSIITSFCAKIYGQRRSRRAAERLISELKCNN